MNTIRKNEKIRIGIAYLSHFALFGSVRRLEVVGDCSVSSLIKLPPAVLAYQMYASSKPSCPSSNPAEGGPGTWIAATGWEIRKPLAPGCCHWGMSWWMEELCLSLSVLVVLPFR